MIEIMYKPEDVGKKVINSRGKLSTIRKYHMTDKDIVRVKKRWLKEISNEDPKLKELAGERFFNPYRKGIYHAQIQALYLLGCNQWHSLNTIIDKIKDYMFSIPIKGDLVDNRWEQFKYKSSREQAIRYKDYIGRIQENMIMFQRLSRLHPTGYKLRQVYSALDIKRRSMNGFSQGCYYYRLSTYDSLDQSFPIRDYREYDFPTHESKYITSKFIGKIITKNGIIFEGVKNEMSSV